MLSGLRAPSTGTLRLEGLRRDEEQRLVPLTRPDSREETASDQILVIGLFVGPDHQNLTRLECEFGADRLEHVSVLCGNLSDSARVSLPRHHAAVVPDLEGDAEVRAPSQLGAKHVV